MALFVVSYDLVKRKDYPELWEAFDKLGAHKCLRSVYLVSANATAVDLRDHLRQHMDDDDQIIVVEFSKRPAPYRCIQGTTAWIDARV